MLTLLLLVIVTALVFEFINGFHDTANSIATVVATKVLTPTISMISGHETWPSALFCRFGCSRVSTRPMEIDTKPMSIL